MLSNKAQQIPHTRFPRTIAGYGSFQEPISKFTLFCLLEIAERLVACCFLPIFTIFTIFSPLSSAPNLARLKIYPQDVLINFWYDRR